MRALIVGNSGSGKTWLATRLAEKMASPVVHLDDIFWLPGGFNVKRELAEALQLADSAQSANAWIAEGVYGSLAQRFISSAGVFIWLDLPCSICLRRLELRGSEGKAHMGREQSSVGLSELALWAESYTSRQGSSGRAAHLAMFESFHGKRLRLVSEAQVQEYLNAAA